MTLQQAEFWLLTIPEVLAVAGAVIYALLQTKYFKFVREGSDELLQGERERRVVTLGPYRFLYLGEGSLVLRTVRVVRFVAICAGIWVLFYAAFLHWFLVGQLK
jgi:hypothetical protein